MGAWCESEGCGVLDVSQVVYCTTPHTVGRVRVAHCVGGEGEGRSIHDDFVPYFHASSSGRQWVKLTLCSECSLLVRPSVTSTIDTGGHSYRFKLAVCGQ